MMKCALLALTFLLGTANSLNYTDKNTREKKALLGVFTIVNFPNDACTSGTSNRNGTCYTQSECTAKGGSSSGSCASSFGVCCIFELTCGSTASENCTYFVSTGVTTSSTSSTSCALKVCKSDSSVCRLRLDFDGFAVAGPLTVTTATTTAVIAGADAAANLANRVGNCEIDRFTATSPGNVNPPTICGISTGDHMYLDASDTCNNLQYTRSTSDTTTASFTIKITQIECSSKNKGGDDCVQYHTAASGTIQTYNYQSGLGSGTHLGSQDYKICIRKERGACAICYSAAATEFGVSTAAPATVVIDTGCGNYGLPGRLDYVLIPGGVCVNDAPNTGDIAESVHSSDKYCGDTLLCPGVDGVGSTSAVYKNTVCSQAKPFKVGVFTDDKEDARADGEAVIATALNQGFKMDYWQTTLCVNHPNKLA